MIPTMRRRSESKTAPPRTEPTPKVNRLISMTLGLSKKVMIICSIFLSLAFGSVHGTDLSLTGPLNL